MAARRDDIRVRTQAAKAYEALPPCVVCGGKATGWMDRGSFGLLPSRNLPVCTWDRDALKASLKAERAAQDAELNLSRPEAGLGWGFLTVR